MNPSVLLIPHSTHSTLRPSTLNTSTGALLIHSTETIHSRALHWQFKRNIPFRYTRVRSSPKASHTCRTDTVAQPATLQSTCTRREGRGGGERVSRYVFDARAGLKAEEEKRWGVRAHHGFLPKRKFRISGGLGRVWLSGDEEGGSCRVSGWGTGGRVSASWGRCVLSSPWHGTGYVFKKEGGASISIA